MTEPTTPVTFWMGVAERLVKLFRDPMFFPMIFIIFVGSLGYQWIPKIARGHIELLDTTSKTLESMDATLVQSNKILETLLDQPYPQEDFRDLVHSEHMEHSDLLVETRDTIKQVQTDVKALHTELTK